MDGSHVHIICTTYLKKCYRTPKRKSAFATPTYSNQILQYTAETNKKHTHTHNHAPYRQIPPSTCQVGFLCFPTRHPKTCRAGTTHRGPRLQETPIARQAGKTSGVTRFPLEKLQLSIYCRFHCKFHFGRFQKMEETVYTGKNWLKL